MIRKVVLVLLDIIYILIVAYILLVKDNHNIKYITITLPILISLHVLLSPAIRSDERKILSKKITNFMEDFTSSKNTQVINRVGLSRYYMHKKESERHSIFSIGYPKYFSKGKWSDIIIVIHHQIFLQYINHFIKQYYENNSNEIIKSGVFGKKIIIDIFPHEIEFNDKLVYDISEPIKIIELKIKPKDTINKIGKMNIDINILDARNNVLLFSKKIDIEIKDYIFDHISRPLINTLVTIFTFLLGTSFLIISLLSKYGISTMFSIPVGVILYTIGIVYMFMNRKYTKIENI